MVPKSGYDAQMNALSPGSGLLDAPIYDNGRQCTIADQRPADQRLSLDPPHMGPSIGMPQTPRKRDCSTAGVLRYIDTYKEHGFSIKMSKAMASFGKHQDPRHKAMKKLGEETKACEAENARNGYDSD